MCKFKYFFFLSSSSCLNSGYGDIVAITWAERVLTLFIFLVSAVVYATIFGNISVMVQGMDSTHRRLREKMDLVDEFCNLYKIPPSIHKKLRDYATESWLYTKGFDMDQVNLIRVFLFSFFFFLLI